MRVGVPECEPARGSDLIGDFEDSVQMDQVVGQGEDQGRAGHQRDVPPSTPAAADQHYGDRAREKERSRSLHEDRKTDQDARQDGLPPTAEALAGEQRPDRGGDDGRHRAVEQVDVEHAQHHRGPERKIAASIPARGP